MQVVTLHMLKLSVHTFLSVFELTLSLMYAECEHVHNETVVLFK